MKKQRAPLEEATSTILDIIQVVQNFCQNYGNMAMEYKRV